MLRFLARTSPGCHRTVTEPSSRAPRKSGAHGNGGALAHDGGPGTGPHEVVRRPAQGPERGRPGAARGEMVALIGASGSGKSTLIRSISSLACCDVGRGRGVRRAGAGGGPAHAPGRRRRAATSGSSSSSSIWSGRLSLLTNVLIGLLAPDPRLARLSWRLLRGREAARDGMPAPGRARRARRAARLDPVRRPAAARRDRTGPAAAGAADARRRADRLARSAGGAPRHGDPEPDQPRGRRDHPGLAAPGRLRHGLLPAHDRAARGRRGLRRRQQGADAGHAARSSTAPRARSCSCPTSIPAASRAPDPLGAAAAAAAL